MLAVEAKQTKARLGTQKQYKELRAGITCLGGSLWWLNAGVVGGRGWLGGRGREKVALRRDRRLEGPRWFSARCSPSTWKHSDVCILAVVLTGIVWSAGAVTAQDWEYWRPEFLDWLCSKLLCDL